MARKVLRFSLSESEYQTLRMWENAGKTEQRMAKRARVILLSAEGKRIEQISKESGLSKQSCSKWRLRYVESGLNGLRDEARKGRPPLYESTARTRVISLACSKPTNGSNQWSIREIARVTGMGSTTVHRILHQGDIKPHKVDYWCGKSPDPEFEEKQGAILGLYLNPPDNALVLAVDEKSQIQALDRTQPLLPLTNGRPKRLTATYKRHGTTCLLAALAVHQGEVDGRCVDRHSHEEFLSFLKYLYRKYPGKQLHVILDNFSAHKHKKIMEWVSHRRRLTLHFTPTYASWLNQIEIWFNIFARDVIKGGIWSSKKELIDQIMRYIKMYNEEKAKPFNWTYSGKPLKI